jgi:molybdopterin synthase sulfur carrier subunit
MSIPNPPQPDLTDSITQANTVCVRLFASLRDAASWSEQLVTLPSGTPTPCTPLLLWRQLGLASVWPPPTLSSPAGHGKPGPEASSALTSSLPAGLRVAINQHFATPDTPLKPGDELAFLPPITGG